MKKLRIVVAAFALGAFALIAASQEEPAPPPADPPQSRPAEPDSRPPADAAEADGGESADDAPFIPSEELEADEEVTFPVDI
jgi:hypothetical protein